MSDHSHKPWSAVSRHREQARSHTGFWLFIRSVSTADPCGSKACSRWRWVCLHPCWMYRRLREQAHTIGSGYDRRIRSAIRPPREQALLPQVLLKQIW